MTYQQPLPRQRSRRLRCRFCGEEVVWKLNDNGSTSPPLEPPTPVSSWEYHECGRQPRLEDFLRRNFDGNGGPLRLRQL